MIPAARQIGPIETILRDQSVQNIGAHSIEVEGVPHVIFDAETVDIGSFQIGEHHRVIGLTLTKCTVGSRGGGLVYTLSAEGARELAAELVDAARFLEDSAAVDATALIAKAAGK